MLLFFNVNWKQTEGDFACLTSLQTAAAAAVRQFALPIFRLRLRLGSSSTCWAKMPAIIAADCLPKKETERKCERGREKNTNCQPRTEMWVAKKENKKKNLRNKRKRKVESSQKALEICLGLTKNSSQTGLFFRVCYVSRRLLPPTLPSFIFLSRNFLNLKLKLSCRYYL